MLLAIESLGTLAESLNGNRGYNHLWLLKTAYGKEL